MLDRSRSQASSLNIELKKTTSRTTISAVLNRIGRIRSLSVDQRMNGLNYLQAVLSRSEQAAPRLISLDIQQEKVTPPRFRLSAGTLQRFTCLTSLDLAFIDFDWQIFPIPTLTALYFRYANVTTDLSWEQFKTTLNQMALLEKLSFDFTKLRLHSPLMLKMDLLYIRDLEIAHSCASGFRYFLRHAKLPCLRKAFMTGSTDEDDDYMAINSICLALLKRGNFGCRDWLIFEEDRVILAGKSEIPEEGPEIEINIHTTARMIMDFTTHLPPKVALDIVYLRLEVQLSAGEVSTIFESLPNVKSLEAWFCGSLVASLTPPPGHPPEARIPLASLTSIELQGCITEETSVSSLLDNFRRCLLSRRERGVGIKYLSVECLETLEQVRLFGEVVEELRVEEIHDGRDQGE